MKLETIDILEDLKIVRTGRKRMIKALKVFEYLCETSQGRSSSEGEMVVVVEDHDRNRFGSMISCPAFSEGNMLVNRSFLKLCTTIIKKIVELYAPTNDLLRG
jgi:hypothetical protein